MVISMIENNNIEKITSLPSPLQNVALPIQFNWSQRTKNQNAYDQANKNHAS